MSERVNVARARECLAGKLSPREFQTFVGILDGRKITDIAREAGFASANASSNFYQYSGTLYKKLKVEGRDALVNWARDRELFEDGEPNDLLQFAAPPQANKSFTPAKAPSRFEAIIAADTKPKAGRTVRPLDDAEDKRRDERVAGRSRFDFTSLNGRRVGELTLGSGKESKRITVDRTRTLIMEVHQALFWVIEKDPEGNVVAMHNSRFISEIRFEKEVTV